MKFLNPLKLRNCCTFLFQKATDCEISRVNEIKMKVEAKDFSNSNPWIS